MRKVRLVSAVVISVVLSSALSDHGRRHAVKLWETAANACGSEILKAFNRLSMTDFYCGFK